jgi:hypothetical protein
MAVSKKPKDFELSEQDIDKALHILGVYDPANATVQNAIDFLIYLRAGVHELAHSMSPEELEKLYKQYTQQKK